MTCQPSERRGACCGLRGASSPSQPIEYHRPNTHLWMSFMRWLSRQVSPWGWPGWQGAGLGGEGPARKASCSCYNLC